MVKSENRELRGLCGQLAAGLAACGGVPDCPLEMLAILSQLSSQMDRANKIKLGGGGSSRCGAPTTLAILQNNGPHHLGLCCSGGGPSPPPSTAVTPRSDRGNTAPTEPQLLEVAPGHPLGARPAAPQLLPAPQPRLLEYGGNPMAPQLLPVGGGGADCGRAAGLAAMISGGPPPPPAAVPVSQLQEQAEQALAAYAAAVEGGDEAALAAFAAGAGDLTAAPPPPAAASGRSTALKPPLGSSNAARRATRAGSRSAEGLDWATTATDAVHVSSSLMAGTEAAAGEVVAYGRRRSVDGCVHGGPPAQQIGIAPPGPPQGRRQRRAANSRARLAPAVAEDPEAAASWQSYQLDQVPARPTSADFPVAPPRRGRGMPVGGGGSGLGSRSSSDADVQTTHTHARAHSQMLPRIVWSCPVSQFPPGLIGSHGRLLQEASSSAGSEGPGSSRVGDGSAAGALRSALA